MLSEKAIAVLKKIDTNGLQVLWSSQYPTPYYADGEEMSSEEYHILKVELESFQTQSEYVRISPSSKFLIRTSFENNQKYKRTFAVMPDGTEILTDYQLYDVVDRPDSLISEEIIEEAGEGNWETYTYWKSDYLIREKIDMPDEFEEKVGLLNQYTLTPLALEIINADSTEED